MSIKVKNSFGYSNYSNDFIISQYNSSDIVTSTIKTSSTSFSQSTTTKMASSNTGVIVGATLGSVACIVVLATAGFFIWKYKLVQKVFPTNDVELNERF